MSSEIIKSKTEIAEKIIEVHNGSDTGICDPAASSDAISEEEGRYTQTHRGLRSRHIQLIALGGCIGTGLFVGTGSTLSLVGPAPLVMCKPFAVPSTSRKADDVCSQCMSDQHSSPSPLLSGW